MRLRQAGGDEEKKEDEVVPGIDRIACSVMLRIVSAAYPTREASLTNSGKMAGIRLHGSKPNRILTSACPNLIDRQQYCETILSPLATPAL